MKNELLIIGLAIIIVFCLVFAYHTGFTEGYTDAANICLNWADSLNLTVVGQWVVPGS